MRWKIPENPLTRLGEQLNTRTYLERASRTAIASLTPLLLYEFTSLEFNVVAAAVMAQNLAMLEVRGDYRLRGSMMALLSCLLVLAISLGMLAQHHLALAVLGSMLVAFGAAVWRHLGSNDYGPAFASSSMLLFFVSLQSMEEGQAPSLLYLSALGGILVGATIQMVLWPWKAEHPLRRVVGESWVSLSDYFEALQQKRGPQAVAAAETKLRVDMDHAKKTLREIGQRYRTKIPERLEKLNFVTARIAVRVGAIHSVMDAMNSTEAHRALQPSMTACLSAFTEVTRSVALSVVSRQPVHFATCKVRLLRLQSLLQALRGKVAEGSGTELNTLLYVVDQLREVVDTIAPILEDTLDRAGERALFTLEVSDLQTWQLRPLASALNVSSKMSSHLVKYGLRMAVLSGLGTLAFTCLNMPHGYWLPFTVVIVMQPDYGTTRVRAFERVAGTLLGSIAATAILMSQPAAWVQLLCIGLGMFAFAYFVKTLYWVAVFFVTIYVILLMEHSGEALWQIEFERMVATLAGGGLAIFAAHLFWPVREQDRYPTFFRKVLVANSAYLQGIERHFREGRAFGEELLQLKHASEHAASDMFQSVGRLFSDPRISRSKVERLAALANGNQRVFRIANLLFLNLREGQPLESECMQLYFRALEENLKFLADHAEGLFAMDSEELTAHQKALDQLPLAERDVPMEERLMLTLLARATTEVRAMLTELNHPHGLSNTIGISPARKA